MRKLLLATAATAAATLVIATPAAARDGSGYVGIEGGVTKPLSQDLFGAINFTDTTVGNFSRTDIGRLKYKWGYDVDLIGGYDFGMFRLEGELGYKRAKNKSLTVNSTFVNALNTGAGTTFTTTTDFGLPGHTSVYSAMVNGLLDFGGNGGIGAYVGAGAGYASVHQFGGS
jgi:opacity protein-like surface antigen